MLNGIKSFVRDDDGATMVEYGIIVALIAAICVGVITTIGTSVQTGFNTVDGAIAPSS